MTQRSIVWTQRSPLPRLHHIWATLINSHQILKPFHFYWLWAKTFWTTGRWWTQQQNDSSTFSLNFTCLIIQFFSCCICIKYRIAKNFAVMGKWVELMQHMSGRQPNSLQSCKICYQLGQVRNVFFKWLLFHYSFKQHYALITLVE